MADNRVTQSSQGLERIPLTFNDYNSNHTNHYTNNNNDNNDNNGDSNTL